MKKLKGGNLQKNDARDEGHASGHAIG